jgi:hypothetical protein
VVTAVNTPSDENVRDAIQAAWLARNYYFALDLACRHGEVCPRCAIRHAETDIAFVPPNSEIPVPVWRLLCANCCFDLMEIT